MAPDNEDGNTLKHVHDFAVDLRASASTIRAAVDAVAASSLTTANAIASFDGAGLGMTAGEVTSTRALVDATDTAIHGLYAVLTAAGMPNA